MDLLLAWHQLITSIRETFSPWELAGFLTGIVCVWQVVCRNIWNFPWGILSCACFLILFLQQRLFGETKNLAGEQPERVAQMKLLMEKLITDGRSSNGTKQKNDVVVTRYPKPTTALNKKDKATK